MNTEGKDIIGHYNISGYTDWNKVLFSDESTFQQFSNPRFVWRSRGERIFYSRVKHPGKIHIWGCFSANGFGKLKLFTKNLNAILLIKIYQQGLLPSVSNLFGSDNNDWILQEDNDPKHTSNMAKNWKYEHSINILSWPSNSPDLNPIENIWGIMKVKIMEYNSKNLKGLTKSILSIWKNFDQDLARNLVDSMPNRIQMVIQAKGDYIGY